MSQITIPVAPGELIDKITILEIKAERFRDPAKLDNVRRELALLWQAWTAAPEADTDISELRARLKQVNEKLWQIEDDIRAEEARGDFGERFVALARAVYFTNDARAALKREINTRLGSQIVEEKGYVDYKQRDA